MGNDQSSEQNRQRDAYTRTVLENQRKFYEEKCARLLEQAQSSQQTQMTERRVEEALVGNSNYHGSNTLYPNLNLTREPQPHVSNSNGNNIQTSNTAIDNSAPWSVASTSALNSNIRFGNEPIRVTPSAPPEPFEHVQQPKQGKRPTLSKNVKGSDDFNCETCKRKLGMYIFQCSTGHSSCQQCKEAGMLCGKINCGKIITDMRNRTVEALVAEMIIAGTSSKPNQIIAETSTPDRELHKLCCPNQNDGCRLRFTRKDMRNHLKECPFNELPCPLTPIYGQCSWRGKINSLASHFNVFHPEHIQADVNAEMSLSDLENTKSLVNLITLGKFCFLFHIKVDNAKRAIHMAIQFFGTSVSAAKWSYDFHVYDKSHPRRKYIYSDVCLSTSVPINEIFNNDTCAVFPQTYFKTFENNGVVNYKFFIKRL